MDENLKKIKEIILNVAKEMNIEIDKIILFGSRARGDYREDSDYDILIVTKEKFDKEKVENFIVSANRKIVKSLKLPVDLVILDKEHFRKFEKVYGDISGIANLEGIKI